MRALPATTWQIFWSDVVNSALYERLDENQLDAVKTTLYLNRYFASPSREVAEMWEAYFERLMRAAETCACFQTPGDEALYDIKLWALTYIPVSVGVGLWTLKTHGTGIQDAFPQGSDASDLSAVEQVTPGEGDLNVGDQQTRSESETAGVV